MSYARQLDGYWPRGTGRGTVVSASLLNLIEIDKDAANHLRFARHAPCEDAEGTTASTTSPR
jgi:hypothetical protein